MVTSISPAPSGKTDCCDWHPIAARCPIIRRRWEIAAWELCCDEASAGCPSWVKTGKALGEHMFSALPPKDGVIGRPSLWIAEDFWVLRFRLMVKRGPLLRPQASEGEAQHGPFCWIGRMGQGNEHLHCG